MYNVYNPACELFGTMPVHSKGSVSVSVIGQNHIASNWQTLVCFTQPYLSYSTTLLLPGSCAF